MGLWPCCLYPFICFIYLLFLYALASGAGIIRWFSSVCLGLGFGGWVHLFISNIIIIMPWPQQLFQIGYFIIYSNYSSGLGIWAGMYHSVIFILMPQPRCQCPCNSFIIYFYFSQYSFPRPVASEFQCPVSVNIWPSAWASEFFQIIFNP